MLIASNLIVIELLIELLNNINIYVGIGSRGASSNVGVILNIFNLKQHVLLTFGILPATCATLRVVNLPRRRPDLRRPKTTELVGLPRPSSSIRANK